MDEQRLEKVARGWWLKVAQRDERAIGLDLEQLPEWVQAIPDGLANAPAAVPPEGWVS